MQAENTYMECVQELNAERRMKRRVEQELQSTKKQWASYKKTQRALLVIPSVINTSSGAVKIRQERCAENNANTRP